MVKRVIEYIEELKKDAKKKASELKVIEDRFITESTRLTNQKKLRLSKVIKQLAALGYQISDLGKNFYSKMQLKPEQKGSAAWNK